MAHRKKPKRPKARSKPSTAKKRPKARPKPSTAKKRKASGSRVRRLPEKDTRRTVTRKSAAHLKGWETRRQKAAARSRAAVKGWATRRRKKRVLTDSSYRRNVWEKNKRRAVTIEEFAGTVSNDFGIDLHDAYSLYYSPELAA